MRALVQRVTRASVTVAGTVIGEVGAGLLVLLGVGHDDDVDVATKLADKVGKLRVFADAEGRMNLSIDQVGGGCLVVSQFTLYGDTRSGNRPGFSAAAAPELGEALYHRFVARLRDRGLAVQTGSFGADMQVELVNDGPVTLWLDSDQQFGAS